MLKCHFYMVCDKASGNDTTCYYIMQHCSITHCYTVCDFVILGSVLARAKISMPSYE